MDNFNYDYELERHYHPENFETHSSCEMCGEYCDSVTFSDAGILCDECREELELPEVKAMKYNIEVRNKILEEVRV